MRLSFEGWKDWRRTRMATALAAALALAPAPVPAQQFQSNIIEEVRIVGNQRVEADTVRSYMNIGAGDLYDPERVNQALKNLFDTGLFADVTIQRKGGTLIVQVVENPIINRLVFEGNDDLDDEELGEEVQLRPRIVFTRSRVQSDVQRILELYRRQGRFAATVEPQVIQLEQNRVDLIFNINEGEKSGVQSIQFLGNEAFSDGDLRDQIATKQSRWWRFFSSNDNYDPDRLAFDRQQLREFYLGQGYADFRVVSAVAEMTPDREDFFITFTVQEGPVYQFGKMEVESQIKDLDPDVLINFVQTQEGETYNAQAIEDTVDGLSEIAGVRGYAFVNIRPRIQRHPEERRIDVTYVIQEAPRTYVERIEINGNVRTLDRVIRREMRLSEGDAFNSARMRRSRQRIESLGFFENVEVDQVEGSAPDRTVVEVDVQEQATGELQIGAGFSSQENFIAEVSVRERNLLGRGQDLRLSLSASSLRQSVNIGFTEPYFMGRPLAAGFDLFARSTNFQQYASYDQQSTGGTLRFGFPLSERIRMQTRYTLRRDEIKNVSLFASRFIREAEGTFTTSSIGYSIIWDTRDSFNRPRNGFRLSLSQELAGVGGNVRYIQSQLNYDYYTPLPLLDDWTLKLSVTEGYIEGLGQDVRINDRFFLGGTQLRGFRIAGVGPRDVSIGSRGDSLGGNLMYTGTLEIFVPVGMAEQYGIQFSTFMDVGSLAKVDVEDAPQVFQTGSPRASVGIGISWESPMGPLRIDLSKPIKKEPWDVTETFQFNIGTRF